MAARAAAQWVSMSLKRPSRSLCQWSKEAEGIAAPQALVEEDGEWLYLLQLGFSRRTRRRILFALATKKCDSRRKFRLAVCRPCQRIRSMAADAPQRAASSPLVLFVER